MAEGFFGRFLTNDIGIDLGTTTVLVYVKGQGIVLEEPSVALVEKGTDRIIKVLDLTYIFTHIIADSTKQMTDVTVLMSAFRYCTCNATA